MRTALLLSALLLVVACSEPRKLPEIGETIPNLPVPPSAQLLSREGGEDALKLQFRSTLQPDEVAAYYRDVLSKAPWSLVNDARQPDGSIAMYAEQDGPPLWVTVRKADGAAGSIVDLAGAKVKKPRVAPAPASSPTPQ
ncbi:MAG TPA: hypothetical protein VG692_05855 [Gemmatimonadales bacterium]|nr:hypothetical protein [Gemmatimonadales bacterium]